MISCPSLLLIGANARNAGKTSLACSIIRKFSGSRPIIGLKVIRMRPDEEQFHGSHEVLHSSGWKIREEKDLGGVKDTSRMLLAGASRAFYIQAEEAKVEEAFFQFLELIGQENFIVCESRALRSYVKPGVFILMTRETAGGVSKETEEYKPLADASFDTGDNLPELEKLAARIEIHEGAWTLAPL